MIISKITPILTITINGQNDTGSPNLNAQSVLVCSGRQTYLELAQSQKYIFRCSSFWKIKFLNFYSGWEKPLIPFSNRLVKRWNLIRNVYGLDFSQTATVAKIWHDLQVSIWLYQPHINLYTLHDIKWTWTKLLPE